MKHRVAVAAQLAISSGLHNAVQAGKINPDYYFDLLRQIDLNFETLLRGGTVNYADIPLTAQVTGANELAMIAVDAIEATLARTEPKGYAE